MAKVVTHQAGVEGCDFSHDKRADRCDARAKGPRLAGIRLQNSVARLFLASSETWPDTRAEKNFGGEVSDTLATAAAAAISSPLHLSD